MLKLLWNLASNGESAIHIGAEPGCFESLLHLLGCQDDELRFDAAGLLCNLVQWEENATQFKAIGGVEMLTKLQADHAKPYDQGDEVDERAPDERSVAYLAGIALGALD